MKNRFIEQKKHQARQYHRQNSSHFVGGIISRHRYDEMQPDTLTYWDDAVFIVNDYRVALWWAHPRCQYKDLIEGEAWNRVKHLQPDIDPFKNMIPNYKRVGRSRKKIVSRTLQPDERMSQFHKLWSDTEAQVETEVSFEVRPTLSVNWYNWAKGLHLCVPFEVRSEHDLLSLTAIARRLVKRETTLDDLYGDYVYNQSDWLRDKETMASQGRGPFFSHAVA